MSSDPNRALREKIRAESMYCVTLLDWRGALDAQRVAERFLAFFAQCGRAPSVWLASYGAEQKQVSGKARVDKLLRENASACFELTLRHEREEFAGTWDVSCLFYDVSNANEGTGGLSCLQLCAARQLIPDENEVGESLARFVADEAEFCYGYALSAPYSLDLETYGPGLASSGVLSPALEDPYAWQKELMRTLPAREARPHQQGLLRFVYPQNFLSEAQLRIPVDGADLEAWIRAGGRGRLVPLSPHLWSWHLDDSEIEQVRLELGQKGRLVAFKTRAEPKVRSRLP